MDATRRLAGSLSAAVSGAIRSTVEMPLARDRGSWHRPRSMLAPEKTSADAQRRTGILLSIGAYAAWGTFPLYFKALRATPLEVLANRVVWSALFLLLVLLAQGRLRASFEPVRSWRVALGSTSSACLLAANWFIYIWAVAQARVVDASLGYFITPLVSVSLGVLFFGEALRAGQRLAIATAAAGVLWLTFSFGQLPWVGLGVAFSFGSYSALRKRSVLAALDGLMLEQWLMLPFALGYLLWLARQGQNTFQNAFRSELPGSSLAQAALLMLAGPITSVPLVMFAAGVRRIPLSLVGVLQYISPTLQLLLGVLLWHEPFGGVRLIGYALIWLALLIYSAEGAWAAKLRRRAGLAQLG